MRGADRMIVGLWIAATVACGADKPAPPPPAPSEAVVTAMGHYCKIGEMPADKQREAFKLWGWHNGGDPEMGPLWNRAMAKKDPAAIAMLRAAAKLAVGDGPCAPLEALK